MKTRIDFIFEALAGVSAIMQPDELLRVISIGLTCVSVLISIAFTVYKWYKSAKEDGHIDADEVKDLVDRITTEVDKLKDEDKKDGECNG